MAAVDDILMNLIRNDRHMMLDAQLAHTGQFFSGEHSPGGVLGVTENKQLGPTIAEHPLQFFPVDLKPAVHIHQSVA